jgi:putative membrane protein
MVRRLFGLLVPFLGSAAAVYLSTRVFNQDRFDNVVSLSVAPGDNETTAQTIAIVTVIFGLVNLLVKPVVRLFTFPIRILSFGLFSLIINAGMLLLTGYAADRVNAPFHVELSPWVIAAAAFIGIAAGIFNWLGDKFTTPTKTKVKVVERVVERVIERPAPQVPQYQPRPAPAPRPQYTPPPPPPPQYSPPPAPPTYGPAPQYGPPPQYGPSQYGPPPQPGQGSYGGSTYGQDPYGQGQ